MPTNLGMKTEKGQKSANGRRGFAVIYLLVIFSAMCGLVSLGVDFGRVTLDKAELQLAADAAARNGAAGLPTNSWLTNAVNAAAANVIEGQAVVLTAADVQEGFWDISTATFTPTTVNPNAVKITAHLSAARGTAVATPFAAIIGNRSCDVHVTSIATVVPPVALGVPTPGVADPWLAGMPSGTTANFYSEFGDCAPKNSPVQMPIIDITPGATLNFQFNGTVSNWAGDNSYGCDGDPGYCSNNWWAAQNGNSEHGIGNVTAPIAAVIGVFLDDSQPDSSPAPSALDFSSSASRDFVSLSPLLKQPFFIGDGLRADGVTLQGFVVPKGATRLYIGIMDFQQWSDNSGVMTTTVTKAAIITLVN
jgi:Flp pilus assembly protein TadG